MIEIKHLSFAYRGQGKTAPVRTLEDVSLTVPKGTVCAIIGPSGCGKSTLLKAIAGLLPKEHLQGSITIDGAAVDPKKKCIGFMPQSYGLLPWRTAEENIRLGCKIRHEKIDEEAFHALCGKLGLQELLKRYPAELSGGQQQRVSLARMFLLQPDVLLMDEPFSALDAITREEMQEVFLRLWQQSRVTTMLVTHYVEEALYLGGKILLMQPHPGRIAEILDNPLAGDGEKRNTPAFTAMGRELREKIKAMRGGNSHA